MEEMMKPHRCEPNTATTALAMHKDSHVISKFKPKIRIVHIFAPEIIKTDVANFRELVQRLTGKPTDPKGSKKKAKIDRREEPRISSFQPTKTTELRDGFQSLGYGKRIKEEEEEDEEEMWGGENLNGFLGGLGDFDGFFQGFSEFPLLPLNSSHMDVFGEAHLSY